VIDGRRGALMMCVVAAAPHLFDDFLVASPELALVDVDLAAKLREDIRTGEEFRPRTVARPEFRLLHPVEIAGDVDEGDAAVDNADELPEYVVPHDEVDLDVEPVVVTLEAPPATPVAAELSKLPDYVVATEEMADDVGGGAAFLDVADPPAPEDVSDLPDYIVRADDLVLEEPTISDYPVLPDLAAASVALEETDVALRKIREHMASEEPSRRRRRVRKGFIAASGLGAVAALAVFAVDVQLGVATLPNWLGY
jgi:hypothetical protein